MTIQILPDTFDKKSYEDKVQHPLQSWEWGTIRNDLGVKTVRIGEFKDQVLLHVFQFSVHPIPYTPYKVGYMPRSQWPSQEVIEFLKKYCQQNNIIFIKIEPYELKTKIQNHTGLVHSAHPLFPEWTQILDLQKSDDELIKNLKPKTRYNIKLAQKKGVTIKEEPNQQGLKVFLDLYFETCKRQKYFGHTRKYHETIWHHFKDSISHILVAYYENIPLAAYELFFYKKRLYYVYGGTSDLHRNLMASNLLMWEAILLGKKLGAESFDMWGSLPPDYDPKNSWAGFTRFKEGYGTSFIQFTGSYDLVAHKSLYSLYSSLHSLRSFYLDVKSNLF